MCGTDLEGIAEEKLTPVFGRSFDSLIKTRTLLDENQIGEATWYRCMEVGY